MLARLAPIFGSALLLALAGCVAEEPATDDNEPVELAGGQQGPVTIAVLDGEVYWGNAGSGSGDSAILRVSRSGGERVLITDRTDAPGSISLGALGVTWMTQGPSGTSALLHADLSGGAPSSLAGGLSPGSVATRGAEVFWTEPERGTISSVGIGGDSSRTVVASQDEPGALALDDAAMFWGTRTGVFQLDATNPGSVERVWTGARPIHLALSESSLAWSAEDGTIHAASRSELVASELVAVDSPFAPALALDEEHVFFTDTSTGEIKAIDLADCSISVVASGQDLPIALALDGDFVFWANYGSGTIMRAPKPQSDALADRSCLSVE